MTPKRGRQVYYKEEAIKEVRRYLAYFSLLTNEKMTAFTALHLYRMKDVVEKAFGNIKEHLNMRRLLVSSEKGLDGKIFTEFAALILISHLDKKMKTSELYKSYTLHQLLCLTDKLDVIECFEDALANSFINGSKSKGFAKNYNTFRQNPYIFAKAQKQTKWRYPIP